MGFSEILAILLVVAVCAMLMAGYPVALTLGGVSLAFAAIGHLFGLMSFGFLGALPPRVFGGDLGARAVEQPWSARCFARVGLERIAALLETDYAEACLVEVRLRTLTRGALTCKLFRGVGACVVLVGGGSLAGLEQTPVALARGDRHEEHPRENQYGQDEHDHQDRHRYLRSPKLRTPVVP